MNWAWGLWVAFLVVQGCAAPQRVEPAETSESLGATNFLLITLDTLRADHLGSYGYARPTSPALDALAHEATRFADVTCSMPTTLPSHLTILTGLTPREHGVRRNGELPGGELHSIFHRLKDRFGARTAAVTAARVLDPKYLGGLGLDELFFGDDAAPKVRQVAAPEVVRRGLRWLDDLGFGMHSEGEEGAAGVSASRPPFALWLHFFDTHEPYDPEPAVARRFTGGYSGSLGTELSVDFLVGLNDSAADGSLGAADRRYIADLYDAEIAELDRVLGDLFTELRRRGLWDDLLVVVIGDHGQAHGEDGFWGHGERLLEPVIRVPFVLKEPGQRTGRVVESPVETLDLVPTLVELLGIEESLNLRGRSLVPALRGEELEARAYRVVERRFYPKEPRRQGVALQAGGWKLVAYHEAEGTDYRLGRREGEGGLDGEDFFNRTVPEARFLAEALADLRGQRPQDSPVDAGDRELLRALGYVD